MASTTTSTTTTTRHFSVGRALLAAIVTPTLLLGACFSTPEPECAFACGQNNACPDNYRCAGDGWCKRNDVNEDFVCSTTPLIDATTPAPDSATVDASLVDAGPDASATDASPLDAMAPDAADAAPPDAADAAPPDAAPPPDAADAAPPPDAADAAPPPDAADAAI